MVDITKPTADDIISSIPDQSYIRASDGQLITIT
jgi:hypothetical protein